MSHITVNTAVLYFCKVNKTSHIYETKHRFNGLQTSENNYLCI